MRRYAINRSDLRRNDADALEEARRIREAFHDKPAEKETPVRWEWPRALQEVGTCEAVMYASPKWQPSPRDIIDYKHRAEGPQRLLVRRGFVKFTDGSDDRRFVGPTLELDGMPGSFAVLDRILGVQCRLYEGTNERPRLSENPDEGYYQIDCAGWLGAAKHPETGETFLIIYDDSGVNALVVGEILGVEADGIVGN